MGNITLMECLKSAKGKQLVIGGHRGHMSDVRENTIRNFRQLDKDRIPYIEIDVQLTKDQQLVIFHDQDLSVATALSGTLRDYSLEELRASFEINTVSEVLDWAMVSGMGIAFELKLYPEYARQERNLIAQVLTGEIQSRACHDNCFVFGKDYNTLRQIRALDKKINIAIIAPKERRTAFDLMAELDAFMYLDWVSGFDKGLVAELHEGGYLADGSVVDTLEDLRLALSLGLDMIESNVPMAMIAMRNQ